MDMVKIISIYGIVQGIGFRPFVKRLADSLGIRGSVENTGSCVKIYAEGSERGLDIFLSGIREKAPRLAYISRIETERVLKAPSFEGFDIVESTFSDPRSPGHGSGEGSSPGIFIPPDIAVCPDCMRELYEKGGRRYLHPFINCTLCGPRMSILENLPYDRERTVMKIFPMCGECRREYEDPGDRRYDAQPVCCNGCGPEYRILGGDLKGADALRRIREVIISGGIAAVKGIGGFHLCCSALDESAVRKLRERKHRPVKPFAVMFRDPDSVKRNCSVDDTAAALLTGPEKPVVILDKREDSQVAYSVAPGNPTLGVMLPYAPVQLILFRMDDPLDEMMPECLVMTSGNISDSPICRDDREAERYLSGIADLILTHNREIRTRSDDSVTDIFEGKPYMIRRSRGYAPLPFTVKGPGKDGLSGSKGRICSCVAFGGDLKNSLCISRDEMFYLSPYIGDMSDERSLRVHGETLDTMTRMLAVTPEAVACDLHPDYASSCAAEKTAHEMGVPLIRVQHHFAHILSCMAENDVNPDHRVVGVCFDGTGFGTDGTVWGGEILECCYDGFERVSHIAPFIQTGGDRAVREGWRIAVSLIGRRGESAAFGRDDALRLSLCSSAEYDALTAAVDKGINSVRSTSAGRLFDAVSAILGFKRESTFEGEAAHSLQFGAERFLKENGHEKACERAVRWGDEAFDRDCGLSFTNQLFDKLLSDSLSGIQGDELSFYFHYWLSRFTVWETGIAAEKAGTHLVCLSGGVFQNKLLLKLLTDMLSGNLRVLTHSLVPANDGGIALGQCVYAAFRRGE